MEIVFIGGVILIALLAAVISTVAAVTCALSALVSEDMNE